MRKKFHCRDASEQKSFCEEKLFCCFCSFILFFLFLFLHFHKHRAGEITHIEGNRKIGRTKLGSFSAEIFSQFFHCTVLFTYSLGNDFVRNVTHKKCFSHWFFSFLFFLAFSSYHPKSPRSPHSLFPSSIWGKFSWIMKWMFKCKI